MSLSGAWERNAHDWIAWARATDHDPFWSVTLPALLDLLPPPSGRCLDLGCGEGRLGRALSDRGYAVIGVDRSPTLVAAAVGHEHRLPAVLADGAALPLAAASVDLVIASMSLQDMDDLAGGLSEVGRVLRPTGVFCFAIVHPFATAGNAFHDDGFAVGRPYLDSRRYVDDIERDGLRMSFESMHRPLQDYVDPLAAAGLAIDRLSEKGDRVVPWLLAARARKLS